VSGSLTFSATRRPRGARVARVTAIVTGIVLALLLLWAAVVGGVWTYAWLRLGGDDLPVFREDGLATLGSVDGPRAPEGRRPCSSP
jgi:hypothetical protein